MEIFVFLRDKDSVQVGKHRKKIINFLKMYDIFKKLIIDYNKI